MLCVILPGRNTGHVIEARWPKCYFFATSYFIFFFVFFISMWPPAAISLPLLFLRPFGSFLYIAGFLSSPVAPLVPPACTEKTFFPPNPSSFALRDLPPVNKSPCVPFRISSASGFPFSS